MQRGEKCILKCSPEYAYGSTGAGGTIPPNSTLYFEVELLGWSKGGGLPDYWGQIATLLLCIGIVVYVVWF